MFNLIVTQRYEFRSPKSFASAARPLLVSNIKTFSSAALSSLIALRPSVRSAADYGVSLKDSLSFVKKLDSYGSDRVSVYITL